MQKKIQIFGKIKKKKHNFAKKFENYFKGVC